MFREKYLHQQFKTSVNMIKGFSFWKNVDDVPGVTYKIFSGTTTSNAAVCANGQAEVEYSYTSVSAGNGSAIFYSTLDGCPGGVLVTITSCLPSDATALTLVNGGDPLSGTAPRSTPTATLTNC
jgi:hypothetical protein